MSKKQQNTQYTHTYIVDWVLQNFGYKMCKDQQL